MEGYKSFGTNSMIIFDENFTCLIGPPGSGKSNIIKAIEFVLGTSEAYEQWKIDDIFQEKGKKVKKRERFVKVSLDTYNNLMTNKTKVETISKKITKEGITYFLLNDDRRLEKGELEGYLLPKITSITNLNVLTKEKLQSLLELYLLHEDQFSYELAYPKIYSQREKKED